MEDDILEGILGQVHLGSTNPPDVQDVPTRDLERRCVSGGVKILPGTCVAGDHSR